jgi:hypothetical protein
VTQRKGPTHHDRPNPNTTATVDTANGTASGNGQRKDFYTTSASNGRRYRRTQAELAEIDAAIYDIAYDEEPITVRGLFYRVMSRGLVPKTEAGYHVVRRQALKMRRSADLPDGWITDGSRLRLKPKTFSNMQAALTNAAKMYRRDLWIDQGVHVEVWTEKDAIRGVVWPITDEYDVPLMISRGFSSETFLYETAEDITNEGNPAVIYQIGDHDPSGVAAWEDIQRKLTRFVDNSVGLEFERIAVTPEQIVELDLPTRPTKQSDTRATTFDGDSVEVDAIPSSDLRDLVRDAIEQWIDHDDVLDRIKSVEESERDLLSRLRIPKQYLA